MLSSTRPAGKGTFFRSSGARRRSVRVTARQSARGGSGIRTHGAFRTRSLGETAPISHSGTPPASADRSATGPARFTAGREGFGKLRGRPRSYGRCMPTDSSLRNVVPARSPEGSAVVGVGIDVVGVTARAADRLVLNDVSLSVVPGELVALVGGSGAGKTTLLETMAGLRPIAEGAVLHDGLPVRAAERVLGDRVRPAGRHRASRARAPTCGSLRGCAPPAGGYVVRRDRRNR